MALGYTIVAILKRTSHVFSDDRVIVKIDWLEQLNRGYTQVQGKDRLVVKVVAEQLGLDGSYTPRTYIEQIQLEKLVNEVQAMPEDLKTKLSLEEDILFSPTDALARASADRVAWRNKNFKSGKSHSYSNHRDKNPKITRFDLSRQSFDDGGVESAEAVTKLSEQITTLNDKIDEFSSNIEELSSRLTIKKQSPEQQNMILQSEACNGSAPTSYFISSSSNGFLTGAILPNYSSAAQLMKDSSLKEEMLKISRGQKQMLHQLDNLTNLLYNNLVETSLVERNERRKLIASNEEPGRYAMALSFVLGFVGIWLYRGFLSRT